MLGLDPLVKPKKGPQPAVPQTEETTSGAETTPDRSDEMVMEVQQDFPPEGDSAPEVSSELQLDSGDRPDEACGRSEEGKEAEDTPSTGIPPKPLKKPRAEPPRPFRRKPKRDRTGGPQRKNGEKE
jgi:hypothetical protein